MAAKPSSVPRWAQTTGGVVVTGANAPITPNSGKLDVGLAPGEKPPAGFLNWVLNLIYLWTLYLKDAAFVATAASALPGASGVGDGVGVGLSGTGSSAGSAGVSGTGTVNNPGGLFAGQGTGIGSQGTGGATGAGLKGIGGATSGAGVIGIGTAGNSQGGTFTGQGSAAGAQGTGGATGAGLIGTGGATSGDGVQGTATTSGYGGNFTGAGTFPGIVATPGGGGTPARGAIGLASQITPSAPVAGDIWYDTSSIGGGVHRAQNAGGSSWLSKYLFFSGVMPNTASTQYFAFFASNSTATVGTVSALGSTQCYSTALRAVTLGARTTTTVAGGFVVFQLYINGSIVGQNLQINAGSVSGWYTQFQLVSIPAGALIEVRMQGAVGMTTSVGQFLVMLEVV